MNMPALLKLAQATSKKSDHHSHKIACLIINKQGIVLSAGFNLLTKTHPLVKQIGNSEHKTQHAELNALLKLRHKHDLSKLKFFVFRELNSGTLGNAHPCECCLKILKFYKVREVYYTHETGIKKLNL